MAGRVEGKVALVTGAARGQGRSHAVRLAQEGADIIAVDICEQIDTVPYPLATAEDLSLTVKEVEAVGRRVVAYQADVRDFDTLKSVIDRGVEQLGRLDIACANAGVFVYGTATDLAEQEWRDVVDTNLAGPWHTAKAAIPHLVAGGRGGSIIITSSVFGLRPGGNMIAYTTAKFGLVGLMKAMAVELAPQKIRVNAVHPTAVATDMILNADTYERALPDEVAPSPELLARQFQNLHSLPVPWVEVSDISNAIVYLASDDARYVTGITLPVDAGLLLK